MTRRRPSLLCSEAVYDGRRIRVRRDRLQGADGREFVREVVEHPGSAVVVPLLGDGRVVLVRQYRYVIDETVLEFPAGTLEPGEDPARCARRELTEETGYVAGKIDPLGFVYPSPGILDERMRFFLARDLAPGEPHREAGEEMENVLIDREELSRRIREGGIRDAKTVVGMHLAAGWEP